MPVTIASPFRPAWWCRGAHAQTLLGALCHPRALPCSRTRWELPDGDFLDVDEWPAADDAPLLLILHGLEGSSRAVYVNGLTRAARARGWGAAALNFRTCGGELNRLRRAYHAGETTDLAWAVERLLARHPRQPLLLAGVSLGGNVLLKYLGEQGERLAPRVRAAVTISTPFDLAASVRVLERGINRHLYTRRLVSSLRRKALAKLRHYPDLCDAAAVRAARTLTAFDDAFTAPLHGFADANSYWAASSSGQFLPHIRRPTLLINAEDDPFFPADGLPRRQVAENACLAAAFSSSGGHVGFLAGAWPWRPVRWAEQRALAFLAAHLDGPLAPARDAA